MSTSLMKLLDGIPCERFGPSAVQISAIVTDSRRAGPGSLFVALPGQHTHGLLFVKHAVQQGASAILASQAPSPELRAAIGTVPWVRVLDPRSRLGELSARLYGFPARGLRLHAITGTNGKTTTAYMLAHLLTRMGRRTAFWTTNSVEGIATPYRPNMTTPDAPELHRFLREVKDRGAQDVVLEVSSHALHLGRVGGLQFATGAITNITPDHLDFHGSFDAYARTKASLLSYIAPDGGAALNADDPLVEALADTSPARPLLYGIKRDADLRASIKKLAIDHTQWNLVYRGHVLGETTLPVPGEHNIMNALCALALAFHLALDPKDAPPLLNDFAPAPRRLETVRVGSQTIVSDVAMNRGSYDAVLRWVEAMHKPLVVVNAIRGNRGIEVNRDIAVVLAEWDRRLSFAPLIVTLSQAQVGRLSVDYRVRPEEQQAFLEEAGRYGLDVDLHNELDSALDAAIARLPQEGGVLLLLGTFGMDDGAAIADAKLRHFARGR